MVVMAMLSKNTKSFHTYFIPVGRYGFYMAHYKIVDAILLYKDLDNYYINDDSFSFFYATVFVNCSNTRLFTWPSPILFEMYSNTIASASIFDLYQNVVKHDDTYLKLDTMSYQIYDFSFQYLSQHGGHPSYVLYMYDFETQKMYAYKFGSLVSSSTYVNFTNFATNSIFIPIISGQTISVFNRETGEAKHFDLSSENLKAAYAFVLNDNLMIITTKLAYYGYHPHVYPPTLLIDIETGRAAKLSDYHKIYMNHDKSLWLLDLRQLDEPLQFSTFDDLLDNDVISVDYNFDSEARTVYIAPIDDVSVTTYTKDHLGTTKVFTKQLEIETLKSQKKATKLLIKTDVDDVEVSCPIHLLTTPNHTYKIRFEDGSEEDVTLKNVWFSNALARFKSKNTWSTEDDDDDIVVALWVDKNNVGYITIHNPSLLPKLESDCCTDLKFEWTKEEGGKWSYMIQNGTCDFQFALIDTNGDRKPNQFHAIDVFKETLTNFETTKTQVEITDGYGHTGSINVYVQPIKPEIEGCYTYSNYYNKQNMISYAGRIDTYEDDNIITVKDGELCLNTVQTFECDVENACYEPTCPDNMKVKPDYDEYIVTIATPFKSISPDQRKIVFPSGDEYYIPDRECTIYWPVVKIYQDDMLVHQRRFANNMLHLFIRMYGYTYEEPILIFDESNVVKAAFKLVKSSSNPHPNIKLPSNSVSRSLIWQNEYVLTIQDENTIQEKHSSYTLEDYYDDGHNQAYLANSAGIQVQLNDHIYRFPSDELARELDYISNDLIVVHGEHVVAFVRRDSNTVFRIYTKDDNHEFNVLGVKPLSNGNFIVVCDKQILIANPYVETIESISVVNPIVGFDKETDTIYTFGSVDGKHVLYEWSVANLRDQYKIPLVGYYNLGYSWSSPICQFANSRLCVVRTDAFTYVFDLKYIREHKSLSHDDIFAYTTGFTGNIQYTEDSSLDNLDSDGQTFASHSVVNYDSSTLFVNDSNDLDLKPIPVHELYPVLP